MKSLRRISLLLIIFAVFTLMLYFSSTTPGAADEFTLYPSDKWALLQIPDGFIRNPQLSPDGRFVFANAGFVSDDYQPGNNERMYSTHGRQYLWRLTLDIFQSALTELPYDYSFEFDQRPFGAMAAFSPDSQYLALRNDEEIALLSLSDMQLTRRVSVERGFPTETGGSYSHLQWSPDGDLVATLDRNGIVVWDITKNTTYYHELPKISFTKQYDDLIVTKLGWIVTYGDNEIPLVFSACSWRLERCQNYEFEQNTYTVMVSHNGRYVWTIALNPDYKRRLIPQDEAAAGRRIGLWESDTGVDYELHQHSLPIEMRQIRAFSPQGNYQLVMYTDDTHYREWAVYSFPELERLSFLMASAAAPVWIEEEHLVSLNLRERLTLRWHKVGVSDFLYEQDVSQFYASRYPVDLAEASIQSDDENQYVLVYFASKILIIPIERG